MNEAIVSLITRRFYETSPKGEILNEDTWTLYKTALSKKNIKRLEKHYTHYIQN